MPLDEKQYDKLANETMARIERAFDDVDPDEVEPESSDGVVKLVFPESGRRTWVVSTQRAAQQIWLAAEQQAWHFAHQGDDPGAANWISTKSDEELFPTLQRLCREHLELELEF